MSMSQSNLSSARYGYDFVVATSQASINSTIKQFLSKKSEPEVTICWVHVPKQSDYQMVDYAQLLSDAKGSDPFKVPANVDTETNQDVLNLKAARFRLAIRAKIGIPPVSTHGVV